MAKDTPKVVCKTPTPGKQATRIDRWKYDAVRTAILRILPKNQPGLEFRQLPKLVKNALSAADRAKLGSIPWYTTTVKLDLEVRGEIERIPGSSPQRLRRAR